MTVTHRRCAGCPKFHGDPNSSGARACLHARAIETNTHRAYLPLLESYYLTYAAPGTPASQPGRFARTGLCGWNTRMNCTMAASGSESA